MKPITADFIREEDNLDNYLGDWLNLQQIPSKINQKQLESALFDLDQTNELDFTQQSLLSHKTSTLTQPALPDPYNNTKNMEDDQNSTNMQKRDPKSRKSQRNRIDSQSSGFKGSGLYSVDERIESFNYNMIEMVDNSEQTLVSQKSSTTNSKRKTANFGNFKKQKQTTPHDKERDRSIEESSLDRLAEYQPNLSYYQNENMNQNEKKNQNQNQIFGAEIYPKKRTEKSLLMSLKKKMQNRTMTNTITEASINIQRARKYDFSKMSFEETPVKNLISQESDFGSLNPNQTPMIHVGDHYRDVNDNYGYNYDDKKFQNSKKSSVFSEKKNVNFQPYEA